MPPKINVEGDLPTKSRSRFFAAKISGGKIESVKFSTKKIIDSGSVCGEASVRDNTLVFNDRDSTKKFPSSSKAQLKAMIKAARKSYDIEVGEDTSNADTSANRNPDNNLYDTDAGSGRSHERSPLQGLVMDGSKDVGSSANDQRNDDNDVQDDTNKRPPAGYGDLISNDNDADDYRATTKKSPPDGYGTVLGIGDGPDDVNALPAGEGYGDLISNDNDASPRRVGQYDTVPELSEDYEDPAEEDEETAKKWKLYSKFMEVRKRVEVCQKLADLTENYKVGSKSLNRLNEFIDTLASAPSNAEVTAKEYGKSILLLRKITDQMEKEIKKGRKDS